MSGHELGGDAGTAMALLVAVLLGLRHATDADHLTAIATLVLSQPRAGGAVARRAGRLGLAWGLGHATTLVAVGLPLVLLGCSLPDAVQRGAELVVGLLIAALAVRLLVRWRRGYLHMHAHRHGELLHAHPHFHEHSAADHHPAGHRHEHRHEAAFDRSPLGACGVGLVHGVGGSAAAGVLVVAAFPDAAGRALALILFALATGLSMGAVSYAVGYMTCGPTGSRSLARVVPAAGMAGLLFGLWYAVRAMGFAPPGHW